MTLTRSSSAPGPGGSAMWSTSMNVFATSPAGIRSVSGAAASCGRCRRDVERAEVGQVVGIGARPVGRVAPAALERVDELRLIVRGIRAGEHRLVGHDGELIAHRVAEPRADLVDHAGHPLLGVQVRRWGQHDRRRILGRRGRRRLRGFGGEGMLLRRLGGWAGGSGFGGEASEPIRAQPMAPAITTARPVTAAMTTGPLRSFDGCAANGCTASGACRSSTNDCSSPNVAALVALLTRCRCSSDDSCPSASALSSTWQVSVRSLSLARVLGVLRVATKEDRRGRDPSPQTDADAPVT